MPAFKGFPEGKSKQISIPEVFFHELLPKIDDLAELKLILYAFFRLEHAEGSFRYLRRSDLAAEAATPENINFMAKYGRGLICLTLTSQKCDQLRLQPMVSNNTSPFSTAFTVSIEAKKGVTTGISAADRAHTVITAVADDTRPEDLVRPGHIFPLRARTGGVLVRTGQTEGSVDLARLAGLKPAEVICEIMNEDGTMARMPDLFMSTNIATIVRGIRNAHSIPNADCR